MLKFTIGIMLLCVGAVTVFMLWVGFKQLTKLVWLRRHGHRVKGKVVKIELEDAGEQYIRWVTVAYSVASADYSYRYWTGKFVMDQEVTLLHAPDNPREVLVLDWTTMWLIPLILILPGIVMIGLGILALVLGR